MRGGKRQVLNVQMAEFREDSKPGPSLDLSQEAEIEALGVNVVPAGDGKNGLPKGLAVLDINPAGRGADAGLVQGDIILSVDGADIAKPADLEAALNPAKMPGRKHALAFIQRGTTQIFVPLPGGEG